MKKRFRAVLVCAMAAGVLGGQQFVKPDTQPEVLSSAAPSYTQEATAARIEGDVLVSLVVDVNGDPTMMRVMRGLGYGLDEKALQAVRAYKFKPAMKDGLPVPVGMYLRVRFSVVPPVATAPR